jgi:hypothetical protein
MLRHICSLGLSCRLEIIQAVDLKPRLPELATSFEQLPAKVGELGCEPALKLLNVGCSILEATWALRRDGMVAMISGATWGT